MTTGEAMTAVVVVGSATEAAAETVQEERGLL